jgi:TusA-related sulfurtransferase|tara:strand:- start:401 stop:640 length:240 start_codon:yes stop_codon:yes gene_type:complete
MEYDYLVDATGETCPMPLLRAKQQLNKMNTGECVKVMASDAASVRDFASFISLAGHELHSDIVPSSDGKDVFQYFIVKR